MMKNPHDQQVELNIGSISSTELQQNIAIKICNYVCTCLLQNLQNLYAMKIWHYTVCMELRSFKIHNYMYVCTMIELLYLAT